MSSDASGFGLSQINPLRYRGYYYDQETGLYYLQTRYYDPKVRRFLNADDASVLTKDPEQLTEKNLYAYCDDNPVMYRDDTGMFDIVSGIFGAVTNVATTYFAAKVTGQECGVWDLAVAAFAGLVSGMTKSSLYITLVSAFISGVGTTIGSLAGGSDIKEALWKGGMTALCTAVSVNAIAGWKIPVSDVVKNISGTIFGIGNGLVTAGVVASFPYRKSSSSSSKKNISQNKRKSNPVVKNYKKTAKQKERARKYFIFKMNQLREG